MTALNASGSDLCKALFHVNSVFGGNIEFKNMQSISARRVRFTLTVHDSRGPGARLSPSGRRIAAACWHVHGLFFEELFKACPNAEIRGGHDPKTGRPLLITADGGNWQDRNIGSVAEPFLYSRACGCTANWRKGGRA
jgi:hypothetical protein